MHTVIIIVFAELFYMCCEKSRCGGGDDAEGQCCGRIIGAIEPAHGFFKIFLSSKTFLKSENVHKKIGSLLNDAVYSTC